jgi:hypothetical protein
MTGSTGPDGDTLRAVVAELCELEGIALGEGDLEAVARIYREYLDLADALKNEPLAMEAAPPLRLDLSRLGPDRATPQEP